MYCLYASPRDRRGRGRCPCSRAGLPCSSFSRCAARQLLATAMSIEIPSLLRELGERAPLVLVARLRPRIDRAVAQRARRVGDDERFIVLERRAEAVAPLARAARAVEREELRRRRRRARAVVRALEALGEAQPRRPALGVERRRHRLGEEDDAVAVAFAERGADRVGEPPARLVAHHEPVDDDEQLLRERDVDRSRCIELVEMLDRAVDATRTKPCARRFSTTHLVRDLVATA